LVLLWQSEAKDIKNIIRDPIIRLVGFKKKDQIKLHHHVAPASFIYPDEKNAKGSSKLFKALLDRCIARAVVPLVWFLPRRNVNLRLCAMIPQAEVVGEDGDQKVPPGFHVVPMPYAGKNVDYRCTDGRFQLSARCVTILNGRSVFSS
jgi:ATP-dependent DNA helicase 2 subunit 1